MGPVSPPSTHCGREKRWGFNDEPIRTTRGLEDVPGSRARSTAAPSSDLEPSEG